MIRVSAKIICALVVAAAPAVVFGEDYGYMQLVGVPYLEPNSQSVEQYINALYRISITLAAILAVLKLIIAGAKYILTDIITSKEDAKKDIRGALVGLLIVISAVVLLQVINDNLTRFNFLEGLEKGFKIEPQQRPAQCATQNDSPTCCFAVGGEFIVTNGSNYCNTGSESTADIEDEIRDDLLENEEFDEIVEKYDLSTIELSERQNYVNNIWPDQCELDSNGEENGNEFVELEDIQAGVNVFACVRK